MRTIDIITTQNVTINYELADVKDRIFAFILDQIIIWVSILILALILLSSGIMNSNVFVYAIVLPIIIFYHLFLEILFDGRSLGKMILGIRVVKLTGMEPSLNDLVFRWALRPVDILFSLGSIGIMLISSSEKGQRLGDIIANTTVIRNNPTHRVRLADILQIRSADNYEIQYPLVTQFTEQEMLLLKEAMDKSIRYPNEAHEHALIDASHMIAKRLGLQRAPEDRVAFVRTVIKDFVATSR